MDQGVAGGFRLHCGRRRPGHFRGDGADVGAADERSGFGFDRREWSGRADGVGTRRGRCKKRKSDE